ncbi:MAG: hypothetical protein O9266_02070 [Porphyrobacter sp.]|jgi:hypothetical protein|nr:hypothetical protein [Porphyrobacter sp.]
MAMELAPLAGLLGLFGLAGLAGLRQPAAGTQSGAAIRLLGLLGLGGLAGIWIDGAGALGAAGALGLWNHQNPKLARWAWPGWVFPIGIYYLVRHLAA